MPRCALLFAALLGAGLAAPALAETYVSPVARAALLELYTSEGCSSCPPADRWLSSLLDDPRLWQQLVPVAFHVDYWDSLGWPDRFAAAGYAARQHAHVAAGVLPLAYTPGVVLDGREWRGWRAARVPLPDAASAAGVLRLERRGERVDARFVPAVAAAALELNLVRLGFGLESAVGAGENAGRRLRHDFVVLGWTRVALQADGDAWRATLALPGAAHAAARQALAAWVAVPGDPRPRQAVGGWLMP